MKNDHEEKRSKKTKKNSDRPWLIALLVIWTNKAWFRPLMITLCVILSVILITISAGWMYLEHLLGQIDYVQGTEATLSAEEASHAQTDGLETMHPDEELPDISTLPVEPVPGGPGGSVIEPDAPEGDIVNILLIGQDRRPGEGRCRSDSMILVTFNKSNGSITMTSFMRDSYVQIPGYGGYKINHAYQFGGMQLLNDTLYANYGVRVDGDVAVDFSQFEDLIDILGGVDIVLTEKESGYLNRHNDWTLPSGKVRLNGEQALAYSRIRYIDSDYQRASRQRKVLQSLIDRYKSQSVPEMLSTLEEVLGLVSTNMEKKEIVSLAVELFPMLSSTQIQNQQIPAPGTFKGGDLQVRPGLKDWFQYNIDFATNREILREIFDED